METAMESAGAVRGAMLRGRIWKFGDNINTDMMMPNVARTLPEDEQKKLCFESIRPGWSALVGAGDIIVGGKNFGTGSSRPAAKLLKQLGIVAVVAESVNGLFVRNCVNYGILPLNCAGIAAATTDGEELEIDVDSEIVRNVSKGIALDSQTLPDQLIQLALAGGIRPLLKRDGYLK
ncbi:MULTISPECIES: 3-isopropylmalate dehydratase [unclassified Achromobacter]|uniref:LeuD/DmdB family oxidoreductase small subunit n=1 Tax=unclassified Achromobacter TaxID=2626865 RepID=UPI00130371C1|nr:MULTISPECIES: 3-isopropylmalate dehydratase [unclassified Achromobacter]